MKSRKAGDGWTVEQLESLVTGQLPTVLGGRCKNAQRLGHRLNMSTATFGEETGTTKGNQAPRKDMTDKRKENMPDRSWPGLTTTALSTEEPQGGCSDKSATGANQGFKLASKKTIIGTWNVRTLHACGKVEELEHEPQRYHWDIIGLSEVKWS